MEVEAQVIYTKNNKIKTEAMYQTEDNYTSRLLCLVEKDKMQ